VMAVDWGQYEQVPDAGPGRRARTAAM